MSWTLSAAGHCPDPETEAALLAELTGLLSRAEHGTASSFFAGQYVQGVPHAGTSKERPAEPAVTRTHGQPSSGPGGAPAEFTADPERVRARANQADYGVP